MQLKPHYCINQFCNRYHMTQTKTLCMSQELGHDNGWPTPKYPTKRIMPGCHLEQLITDDTQQDQAIHNFQKNHSIPRKEHLYINFRTIQTILILFICHRYLQWLQETSNDQQSPIHLTSFPRLSNATFSSMTMFLSLKR